MMPVDLSGGDKGLSAELVDLQPKFKYALLEVRRFGPNVLVQSVGDHLPFGLFLLGSHAQYHSHFGEGFIPNARCGYRLLKAEGELYLAESFGMWFAPIRSAAEGDALPVQIGHDGFYGLPQNGDHLVYPRLVQDERRGQHA